MGEGCAAAGYDEDMEEWLGRGWRRVVFGGGWIEEDRIGSSPFEGPLLYFVWANTGVW